MNVSYSMAERGNKVRDGVKIVNELILTQGDHYGLSAWAQYNLKSPQRWKRGLEEGWGDLVGEGFNPS